MEAGADCSLICLTSGLVTSIEASYSEDEVTTRSVNPSHPYAQGDQGGSDCMVSDMTAGMTTSLIARSSGSSNSAISGNVLRKSVQRCHRPKVKAA